VTADKMNSGRPDPEKWMVENAGQWALGFRMVLPRALGVECLSIKKKPKTGRGPCAPGQATACLRPSEGPGRGKGSSRKHQPG